MKKILAVALAYANTNSQSKLFVCPNPQNSALTKTDFEALDWVEIGSVGSIGETGTSTNILNYDTWNDTVIQKGKGLSDAGSPVIECARVPSDPGQLILQEAATVGLNNNYAFKTERADGTTLDNGSVMYNRGLVTGPTLPGGRNEDFDLIMFTLGLQQEQIIVNALSDGNPPLLTVLPAITGTETVGETLTVDNGTFTGDPTLTYLYQWFRGGVAIAGATGSTYDLVAADTGKIITARVTATNDSGSASGTSDATGAISA